MLSLQQPDMLIYKAPLLQLLKTQIIRACQIDQAVLTRITSAGDMDWAKEETYRGITRTVEPLSHIPFGTRVEEGHALSFVQPSFGCPQTP